jgi:hypothetical protein
MCVHVYICVCLFVHVIGRTGDPGQVPPKGAPVPDRVCVCECA